MTTPHKATPEQWEIVTGKFGAMVPVVVELIASCVHELRDRIAALEAALNAPPDHPGVAAEMVATDAELLKAWDVLMGKGTLARLRHAYNLGCQHGAANTSARLTGSNHPAKPDSSPTPASGLVEMVADAIVDSAAAYGTADEPAQAAVLAAAAWFDAIGYGATASILRQELQRHG